MKPTTLPQTLLYEALAGYLRPPQANGTEHYDVAIDAEYVNGTPAPAGRLTRRSAPHNERPTPGWFVWVGPSSSILRGEDNNVRYYKTPEDAIEALWAVLSADFPL